MIKGASLTCPDDVDVHTITKMLDGEGRCLILTQDGTHVYAGWTCIGNRDEGCGGTYDVLGGTGRFNSASGRGDFMLTSRLTEVVVTISQGGVTGSFTSRVEWPELKLTPK